MKISEGGREGGGPSKRMDHAQLIQSLVIKPRWQMPIFLFWLLSYMYMQHLS